MHPMNSKSVRNGMYAAVVALALVFGHLSARGQLWVGIGGQAGFMNMENANAPVGFYNDKGFLVRRLREFHWPWGLTYSASYRDDGLLLELALNTKRARVSAESASSGSLQRRDHRFTISSLSPGIGYAVVEQPTLLFYLVGSVDVGYMRYLTRLGDKANISRVDYQLRRRQGFLGLTLSTRFVFRFDEDDNTIWTLAPYVQIPFSRFDFVEFNQVLNPLDWQEVGSTLPGLPVNVGVSLSFDLDLLEFLD